ncbi:MAG: protoheme IX farnesyltransferase [Candidatus Neomarinimicrobiota bacterium]|nr:MAG: protoheme IX farnesyltransferase [Candidatus Neomarinimicrobiota bacterium]
MPTVSNRWCKPFASYFRKTAMPRKPQMASSRGAAYLELVKPRILIMVLVSTFLGFTLGSGSAWNGILLLHTLIGVALVKGGAAALNHYLERDTDALMERTRYRPLPAGLIPPANALAFGVMLVLGGVTYLVWNVNLLTGFLGLLTAFLYVLVYTPLKRVTWLNTTIGAIPGALPAMGGWTAATGSLDAGAWILFGILFFWQHPHFYSIALLYREEYRDAGLVMLPGEDPSGQRTFRQILFHSIALLILSLFPYFLGLSGPAYLGGVVAAGLGYLLAGLPLRNHPTRTAALRLLKSSVIYLPLMMILILLDSQV